MPGSLSGPANTQRVLNLPQHFFPLAIGEGVKGETYWRRARPRTPKGGGAQVAAFHLPRLTASRFALGAAAEQDVAARESQRAPDNGSRGARIDQHAALRQSTTLL